MVKRAIALGGGGPAAGLHIGVLEALAKAGITFDVWALSCIGAWVGIVYNQFDKVENEDRAEKTYQFFKNGVFRDDESYKRFPINTVFGPDWESIGKALTNFVTDSKTYKDLWDPLAMVNAFRDSMSLWFAQHPDTDGEKKFTNLDKGDINGWILNQVLAPNPFVRYFTSMMYLSHVTGLSRINYPHSQFMKSINFERLKKPDKPFIFHNAWNLDEHKLALFSNRPMTQKADEKEYKGPISASSLCACSALPFIEETVKIDGVTYCEGALVDTVNFESLLQEHHRPDDKLDEIWVSRIVDAKQVRKPENLHDALANLCQLFAATVGEDDVRLFKYHVRYDKPKSGEVRWEGTIVEIRVPGHISFKWNHSNLDMGRRLGKAAAEHAIKAYNEHGKRPPHGGPHFINENPAKDDPEGWQELQDTYQECRKRADA
ncbi:MULTISPECIES: patatin-like phospholipase family protein [unclassified Bradyrhizobium]|uniref:patatin-like phospholipase family protein n=1 Tax=unclassified Bradyrhizobium TaxID=2631580 RepID=UPI0024788126|nr:MULTISPECIES: patatin-like phospholipase family protein [unclassified Bradyrhizobium]WGS22947.1 patatin-like phospholipase family protein [Bradyrhizobium sp. ISRA463]WGS29947.1 patatin-like phospholipase family protein [Bradyrhizobium sp. ISRA464]